MFVYGKEAFSPQDHESVKPVGFEPSKLIANFVFIFLYAFILYCINFYILRINSSDKTKLILIITGTIIVTFALSISFSYIQMNIFGFGKYPHRFLRGGMMRDFFISIIVVFSSQLLYLTNKKQQIALQNKILMAENVRTRYETLKNQVDPHFLFNSLNTLSSLIKTDPDKAQEYIHGFSSVFRYTLQNKDILPLYEELKFTESYCSLMQIRYGENLKFVIRVDEKYMNYAIIPLSIQTLVENAIKHNVVSNKYPLTITISTTDDSSLKISNPLQPKKEIEAGEGIGLANLMERYRLKFQKEIIINKSENTFDVIIPLIKI